MSENGHGMLTASNWVQHDCQTFEIESLRELLETANSYGAGENAARLNAEAERDALAQKLSEAQADCRMFSDEAKTAESERDALLLVLRELTQLEADGKQADECAIEAWERARAAIDATRMEA